MKTGPLVTAIVAIAAFAAVIVEFSNNASPYVTVAQAKQLSGDELHVAGDIVKDSVHMDMIRHKLTFDMKDTEGTLVHVVHVGDPPANLQEANKVVAIGGMQNGEFVSHKLLVKCPSKYESKPSDTVAKT
jgi:cytochrome c-type biogenesis protein CcmE